MGAAYSTIADAPVSAAPSLPGAEIGAHVLKALRTMMDPNSALEDVGDESDSDEKRPHSSMVEDLPRVEDTSNTTDNGEKTDSMDFAVHMDIISLSDEIEVGPVHGASPRKTRQVEPQQMLENKKVKESEEAAVDVYMSRVAPMGLVKALSSSSATVAVPNNEKQITTGEQAV